jgi:RNase H-fold protein (predicted Holliday junction resolvase)
LKNEIGFKAKEVLLFKDSLLEKINIKIDLEDERLSTVQALKSINKNSKNKYVDDSSAAIILNNYLEKLRLNNE